MMMMMFIIGIIIVIQKSFSANTIGSHIMCLGCFEHISITVIVVLVVFACKILFFLFHIYIIVYLCMLFGWFAFTVVAFSRFYIVSVIKIL